MIETLNGIKVLELTLAGAGPACGRMLCEYGAESILVEPLKGTVSRTLNAFDYYTSRKRSITLNTKTEEGQEVLHRLIRESDVFLANYRTKGLRNMHLTYEEVKAINPRIIYATLTGFGEEGPIKDAPGNDVSAFWARGGMLHSLSEGEVLPSAGYSIGDIASATSLCMAICAALFRREITGEGMKVSTSLLQNSLFLGHDALIEVQHGEQYPKTRKAPMRSLVNSYRCKDGRYVYICIAALDRFYALLKEFGRTDLLENQRWKTVEDTMYERAPEIVVLMDREFAKYTVDEAMEILARADISAQKVQTVAEVLEDPQAWDNQYFYKGRDSVKDQDMVYPALPAKFGDDENRPYERGPRLGEHTVEILKELGYTEETIQEMIGNSIISDGSEENLWIPW